MLHLSVICLQLVQEFKLLLIVGRRLVFPAQSSAAVRADMTTQVQFRAANGTTAMRAVSLMFPANCRTVVRLMEAWYDAQVSLSTLAGRHFVYIKDGQQAAALFFKLRGVITREVFASHHSTGAVPWPCTKATLPPPCTHSHLQTVMTREGA
jgi:hypothetical protein